MTVGILGCGRIGRVHADAIRRLGGDVRLVVADADARCVRALQAAAGAAAAYERADDLLQRERPAIVHVCTPPETHAALAVAAIEAGAAVLVEKPMALDAAEAGRIAAALDARPGMLCVDHNYLFEPEVLRARRLVGEGRIGRVVAADVVQGVDAAGAGWSASLPGGRATDLLPHGLYLIRHFLGEVRGLAAFGSPAAAEPPGPVGAAAGGEGGTDGGTSEGAAAAATAAVAPRATEVHVLLDCARGPGGVLVTLAAAPWELRLTLRGTAGRLEVDLARQRCVLVPAAGTGLRGRARRALHVGAQQAAATAGLLAGKASGRLRGYPGLRELVRRFHASVRDGLPPPVPFADGAAVAVLLERIRHRLDDRHGRRPELLLARRRSA